MIRAEQVLKHGASAVPASGQGQDDEHEAARRNLRFYDALWADARLVEPQRFNTWPLVRQLVQAAPRRLEIAPGLRPRLPLSGTQILDISVPALRQLQRCGARATQGSITALPFGDASFDLVCALDVVEHVADGDRALAELARVTAADATLLLSVPLHPEYWTVFDEVVGHCRRYPPATLLEQLSQLGFEVSRSAVYGMRPRSNWLLDLGMWSLNRHRDRAMWWYNRVFMPLGVHLQKPLTWVEGMIDVDGVDEVLLVCRRRG